MGNAHGKILALFQKESCSWRLHLAIGQETVVEGYDVHLARYWQGIERSHEARDYTW